jgi:beta-lactamase class A
MPGFLFTACEKKFPQATLEGPFASYGRRMKKTQLGILLLCALAGGILIGKMLFSTGNKGRSQEKRPSAGMEHPSYRLLNPLVNCKEIHISMRELHSFKGKIEARIGQLQSKHKGLYISYYFRDLMNGMWTGINEKDLFSPASLMKPPIMIATLKEAQSNPSLLQTALLYKRSDFEGVKEEAGFTKEDGRYYTIDELLRQMIVYSDNAAALLVMKFIGEDKVAGVEADLDLDVPQNAGMNTNFLMVKSYASMFRVLYNASYLNQEMSQKALSILCATAYKDGIRRALPDTIQLAHKYGERQHIEQDGKSISLQLHHFGIVYYPAKPYLIGIMTRGASDQAVKEQVIYELASITFSELDRQMKAELSHRQQSIIHAQ